ncbi:hypothetical protein BY458DRAFT_501894 [Sporodiniella umbellata]|nr:hypothetical protein BY458DRAFT_501894 [Sporodiniella umbellata]
MHLSLLSPERLSFDPIKPLILRGPPTEDSSTVFSGTVILNLTRSTKITGITATFKSVATTYWPEGIGARGTRLSHENNLSEEKVQVLEAKKNEYIKLSAGTHRFSFAFIIPNSIVETIEDVFGRVKHTIDARVNLFESGIQQILNNWHASRPVLVLRAYMSDSLLTNNSLQDLSRTYEKQLPAADIQLVVERAAFSSGDLFHLKLILEPHRKKVRLEHMEIAITENRRYSVAEARANRTDSETFFLSFLKSVKLVEGGEDEADLRPVFTKHSKGVDLTDTIAYRVTFATPTCMRNIHHTTYYKDILFRHHLCITLTLSFIDSDARPVLSTTSSTSSFSDDSFQKTGASQFNDNMIEQQAAQASSCLVALPPPAAFSPHSDLHARHTNNENTGVIQPMSNMNTNPVHQSTWLSKLRKPTNQRENGTQVVRKRETIRLETPITIFDCRLKEDYGRLPSYSELNVGTNPSHGDDKGKMVQEVIEQDLMLQCRPDSDEQIPSTEPQPQLCPCYFKFRRQMEMASQFQLFTNDQNVNNNTLERIPSIPPPEYVEN